MSNLYNLIRNHYTDVTTINAATNEIETKFRAVNLKAKDFDNKSRWTLYKRDLAILSAALKKYDSEASKEDGKGDTDGIRNVLKAIFQHFAIWTNGDIIIRHVKRADVRYILRFGFGKKIDQNERREINVVKSLSGIQTLVENLIYFHVNGLDVPKTEYSANTAKLLFQMYEEAEKANVSKTVDETAKDDTPVDETAKTMFEDHDKAWEALDQAMEAIDKALEEAKTAKDDTPVDETAKDDTPAA